MPAGGEKTSEGASPGEKDGFGSNRLKLLADIGNTRVKWACADNETLFGHGAFTYTEDALPGLLEHNWRELARPRQVHVASVAAPGVTAQVNGFSRYAWNLEARHAATEKERAGLRNAYGDAAAMGVDRWLAMLAAWSRYEKPLCVIDSGTALTVDIILGDGQHAGGFILPGLSLMAASLERETHGIRAHREQDLQLEFGRSTAACINNGFAFALAGLLDRCFSKTREEQGAEPVTVITGGAAQQTLPLLPVRPVHEPHLVLQGLDIWGRGKNQ